MEKEMNQVKINCDDYIEIGISKIPLVTFWDQDLQTTQTVAPIEYQADLIDLGYDEQLFGYIPLAIIESKDGMVIWQELYNTWGLDGIVAEPPSTERKEVGV